MVEFGIFNDEGCIERGLWSETKALIAAMEYETDEEVWVSELCDEHEEQPKDYCEECNDE